MRNDPTGRALQLLSLLQTQRFVRSTELAERLEVTERTVRRDIDRLRELGYPVDTTTGQYGGYRLAAGAHLPPLVLDDEEAVAIAVGLRHSAATAIAGVEETSLRALAKIEALLPHRLRRRVSALRSSVTSVSRSDGDDTVDPETLSVLAAACRDHEHVRFDYRKDDASEGRLVEPHQLVTAGHRWYLVAWDGHRGDWRTFRVDRLTRLRAVASHFSVREIPGGSAARLVASSIGSAPRPHEARLAVNVPFRELEGALRFIDHTAVTADGDRCVVEIRSEDLGRLTMSVARIALSAPVVVVEPPDLASAVRQLALNLGSAT